jgi:hypothetical protein
MRERLANAYLDKAESSLGEHRVTDAASALKAARQLSPGNARLPSLEAKLQPPNG